MEIIKRIIMWIISFFHRIFGSNKKKKIVVKNNDKNISKGKKIKANSSYTSDVLPSYMMISNQDKLLLISNIQNIKNKLLNNDAEKREIAKIIALINSYGIKTNRIEEYLNKEGIDKLNNKKIDYLLDGYDIKLKDGIYSIIDDYKNNSQNIKENIAILDDMTEYIKNHDISCETSYLINSEALNFSSNEKLDKDILNTIKSWDKGIIDKVKQEYQKVNYVTISTIMIDKLIDQYQKIEEEYHKHHFNKSYYERELGKIKNQIDFLKRIKNSSVVYNEIEELRKELYTKSKDKYDILYNNEIFVSINKKCDELLNKVNQKVIDIKKNEHDKEKIEDKKEKEKEEYLKKILLRFQDLTLSRNLILLHKGKEKEILDYSDMSLYLDSVYLEFIDGISDNFNYQRNRKKTELVKLYNDLNNIISHEKKENHISIDHINFRMEDLVDAVAVRKQEVEAGINISKKLQNSELVDEKIHQIREKFIGNNQEKILKKTN